MNYKGILKELYVGLGLTVSLWMLYFVLLEDTRAVGYIRWQTFRVLERTSSPFRKVRDPRDVPIILIDISSLRPTASETGFTPRDELKKILLNLVCVPARGSNPPCTAERALIPPAVIGVDIDFSPQLDADNRMRFIDPNSDPSFFEFCERFDAPVFLGVSRTVERPWNFWLGLPQYKQLAAALWLDEKPERSLTTGNGPPSFASALASTYLQKFGPRNSLEHREGVSKKLRDIFLEQESETRDAGVRNTVIDYNGSRAFEIVEHYDVASEVKTHRDRFSRKIVIIGDAHNPGAGTEEVPRSDVFRIPFHDGTIGGSEVHAAAVYTLINPNTRFWTLRRPWDLTADLLLAGLITLGLAYFRYRRGASPEEKHSEFAFVGAALALVFLGMAISSYLIWDGCLVVAVSLALHPFFHRKLTNFEERWKHHLVPKGASH